VTGTISSVEDHGSLAVIWIDTEGGGSEPVYLEGRCLGWILDGEACGPDGLVGRIISQESGDIEFLD
jgi:hypothetical protein